MASKTHPMHATPHKNAQQKGTHELRGHAENVPVYRAASAAPRHAAPEAEAHKLSDFEVEMLEVWMQA